MKRKISRYHIQPGGRHVNSPESRRYIDYGGWKIHLTVRPENYEMVDMWLDKNHPGQYKLLHGGDAGEKDFTIYIGDKDDAIILARKMLRDIGNLLERNNAGSEDVKLHEKIAMRFDPRGEKNRFKGRAGFDGDYRLYYGRNGIPYDRRAADIRSQINIQIMNRERDGQKYPSGQLYKFEPERLAEWEKKLLEHEEILKQDLEKQYGRKFIGSGEVLRKKKKSIKPKTKRKSVRKCRCK